MPSPHQGLCLGEGMGGRGERKGEGGEGRGGRGGEGGGSEEEGREEGGGGSISLETMLFSLPVSPWQNTASPS